MGYYIDPSGILAGAAATATLVRGLFNTLDTATGDRFTGITPITPNIDGGTIDGAVIGGAAPEAGTFTTLETTASGESIVAGDGSSSAGIAVNGSAASTRAFRFLSSDSLRWNFEADSATESGGNAGTDFKFVRWADDGGFLGIPFQIRRSDGRFTIENDLDHNGSGVGFYGATPASKPTVTGSRGSNAALASLLTALATLGLITDSSS